VFASAPQGPWNQTRRTARGDEKFGNVGRLEMKNAKDTLKIVGIVMLCLFVLVVGVPLMLSLVGITLGFITSLAVGLIKLAVFMAIIYLVLVGLRAILR